MCLSFRSISTLTTWLIFALAIQTIAAASATAATETVTFPNSNYPVTFAKSLNIPAGTPLYSVLDTVTVGLGVTADLSCSVTKTVTVSGKVVENGGSGGSPIYATGLQGIGIRYFLTSNWYNYYESVPSTTPELWAASGSFAHFLMAELVLTGPVGAGPIGPLPSLSVTFSPSPTSTCKTIHSNTSPIASIATSTAVVNTPTCTVANYDSSVPLPAVSTSSLPSNGSTSASQPFNIKLDCPANANAFITLTDASNPANVSSVLSASSGSAAKGVGIVISRQDNSRVSFGPDSSSFRNTNQWSVGKTTSAGSVAIPLRASYVRTGDITPGAVSAIATFTMSYQ